MTAQPRSSILDGDIPEAVNGINLTLRSPTVNLAFRVAGPYLQVSQRGPGATERSIQSSKTRENLSSGQPRSSENAGSNPDHDPGKPADGIPGEEEFRFHFDPCRPGFILRKVRKNRKMHQGVGR